MNLARKLYQLTLGLSLAVAPMVAWAQDHPQLSEKVQSLAERDPAGGIMTFTAVLVVFLALLMLVLIFRCIGIFFQRRNAPKVEKPVAQKAPAASSTGRPSAALWRASEMATRASAEGLPVELAAGAF